MATPPPTTRVSLPAAAIATALLGGLLLTATLVGHRALDGARRDVHALQAAAGIADSAARSAAKTHAAGANDEDQRAALAPLYGRHRPSLNTVFTASEGGVDDFGIARGARLVHVGDALTADQTKQVLEQGQAVLAAAAEVVERGGMVPFSRLQSVLADGRTV